MTLLYLDHNATTPVAEQVVEAMLPYLHSQFGNPSSLYSIGREAKHALSQAREYVAEFVGAHPDQVIFTSGGTEANNLAIKGYNVNAIALSAIEHPSVTSPVEQLQRQGVDVFKLPVNEQGVVLVDELPAILKNGVKLVSVMWANNESGVIQQISTIHDICQQYGAALHSDAVQMAGKMALHFSASGLEMMSLSAHKLYGPKGIGALIVKKGVELNPTLSGGGQERGVRSGTENIPAIVGFGEAARLAHDQLKNDQNHFSHLRDQFEKTLKKEVPEVIFFSYGVERVPNTSMFSIPGLEGQTLVMALDKQGIAVSSGSACGSHHKEPSKVLAAMGIDTDLATGAVRVSFGRTNRINDVETVVNAIKKQVKQFQKMDVLAW